MISILVLLTDSLIYRSSFAILSSTNAEEVFTMNSILTFLILFGILYSYLRMAIAHALANGRNSIIRRYFNWCFPLQRNRFNSSSKKSNL